MGVALGGPARDRKRYPSAVLLGRPDIPRPTSAAREKARRLLDQALGPSKVVTGEEACLAFASDESEAEGVAPDAVVLAESADDILAALRVARLQSLQAGQA